ncbi:MAG: hypothetical protein WAM11_00830 [Cyanobium sp.]
MTAGQGFYEVYWHGEAIGDGGDLQEALACFALVAPDDGNWEAACAHPDAEPRIERHASFEAFLDNDDALEIVAVSAAMIVASLPQAQAVDPA